MASPSQTGITQAPEWFGSAACGIAYFPIMMSAYAVFYSAWWPFAWGYVGAGVLALDAQVSWLVVFAVAGVGGAVAILCYAVYMAWAYRRLCERAGVPFPLGTQRDLD